ncbi:hypothetical protein GCM10009676_03010 [Prauserella halophila]|uniref:6-phosphofructokinase n=1 Tax=Prauserella halophila TaxID=185641 RepID=A0ABN1VWN0_9PSEU
MQARFEREYAPIVVAAEGAQPDAVAAVADGDSGVMTALRGTGIVRVPLVEATAELKTVPAERYAEAEVLFG